jgi:hypothetical protein
VSEVTTEHFTEQAIGANSLLMNGLSNDGGAELSKKDGDQEVVDYE